MRRSVLVLFVCSLLVPPRAAAQQPPALLDPMFQDHAVLQRDRPVPVWGRARAGERVTLTFNGRSVEASAGADGRWQAQLPAMPAGGPFELTAVAGSGEQQRALDVMVGDVWLCSGQSNMELPVSRTLNAPGELRDARNDSLRLLTVAHADSASPLDSFRDPVHWQRATPESVAEFSGTCYYFARELQKTQRVPMGLIHSSWGGSNIEAWIGAASLRTDAEFAEGVELLDLYVRDRPAATKRFADLWERWWRARTQAPAGEEPWRTAATDAWSDAPAAMGDWKGWGVPELAAFHGMVWYRRVMHLTAAQAAQPATLALGAIDEVDQTWVNGTAIGGSFGWGTRRTYDVPPGVLKEGDNTVVVNVLSTWGAGGLIGPADALALRLQDGTSVPLAGGWRYRTAPPDLGPPPRTPWHAIGGLTTLYNAMIAPLGRYGLRGAVWYQGESNTNAAEAYEGRLAVLMADWRGRFGADLPFLVVQLPNFGPAPTVPVESDWARLRESQRRVVQRDRRAGLAVTIDLGDRDELHPPNKQGVGRRLARAARRVVYGESIAPSGPVPASATRQGAQVVVAFGDVEGRLVAYSSTRPIGFELCAAEAGSCRFASATLDGNRVVLDVGDAAAAPTRVRYCWGDGPICTLYDEAGLPAGPFEVPIGTALTGPPQLDAAAREALAAATAADHDDMMKQLGIRSLRPGRSPDESAANAANYDEALADPFPNLPEALRLENGQRVTSAETWWKRRRPEIVEEFEREVVGRVPANVPKVTWTVQGTERWTIRSREVIGKQLLGRVDNSAHPDLEVEIRMALVTPADAKAGVPVMIMFGPGLLHPPPSPFAPPPQPGGDPPATEQLIAAGWGYASLSPASIQADNGAGLTSGIIGLANRGQRRKPDDWGALRAWAWGASRALDYLETDAAVDAKRVGIEGVSRYGKAALVTMAFDTRFAVALIGSSGEGGAKLHRRNFGEAVENLTGRGAYHWMAGNFLKYGAAESSFGSRNAGDLPVDAHQLIALCAPRPVFISYGIPERGDAKWLDQQGSFMAAVAAQPVYRLLGAKDLGRSDDYKKEKMPPVNAGLLDGQLAWRQHDGGHTDGPNWKYFIPWADRMLRSGSRLISQQGDRGDR